MAKPVPPLSNNDLRRAVEEAALRATGFTPNSIPHPPLKDGYLGPYPADVYDGNLVRWSVDLYLGPEWAASPGPLTTMSLVRGFLGRCTSSAYTYTWGKAASDTLIKPRNRDYAFPIQLYRPPSDKTSLGECYAMLLAMSHAVYQQRKKISDPWPPNKALYIDNIVKPPVVDKNGNTTWNLGEAEKNYYNDHGSLKIQLNQNTFLRGPFTWDDWSGAIDHEVLHNLGWEHDDNYDPRCYMLVHEGCVSGHPRSLARYLKMRIQADR